MDSLILKEVEYYACNQVTKKDVAIKFNRSISSIKKDFAKFREIAEVSEDEDIRNLYKLEIERSNAMEHQGKVKGGTALGSGKDSLDLKTVLEIAKYIKYNDCSLSNAESHFNIPKSTIYENIEKLKDSKDATIKELYDEVHKIYDSNRKK